ncbi:MAG: polymer-forming cytoskeletal protein [Nitrospirae bacterium]|nr:polymer-forming cytoskeletal protein [Nitrospirota bacterium]
MTKINGFIGRGVNLVGKLSFDGILRIDGKFQGEIDAAGTLVVGEDAVLESMIRVGTALISGEVRGIVEAANKVEIMSAGRMFGDIRTPAIVIYKGAVFEGNCEMGSCEPEKHLPAEIGPAENE